MIEISERVVSTSSLASILPCCKYGELVLSPWVAKAAIERLRAAGPRLAIELLRQRAAIELPSGPGAIERSRGEGLLPDMRCLWLLEVRGAMYQLLNADLGT